MTDTKVQMSLEQDVDCLRSELARLDFQMKILTEQKKLVLKQILETRREITRLDRQAG